MLTVEFDLTEFDKIAKQTERVLGLYTQRAVKKAVDAGVDFARKNHKHTRRTGRLTSSAELKGRVTKRTPKGADGEITNTTDYAPFVEFGTVPHVIRPKKPGGVLVFQAGGKTVFARIVNHPGTPAMPFMEPAGEHARDVMIFETHHVTFAVVGALWD